MSDPVSNAEIEDVLSSIRRLISESKHSEGRNSSAKSEKLVLTPAFRVHDESNEDVQRGAVHELAEAESGATPTHDVESDVDTPSDVTENVADSDADIDAELIPVFSHRGYSNAPIEDAEELPARSEDADEDIGAEPYQDDEMTLTGRAAEFEDAVSQNEDSWEPDGGEETTQSDVLMFHAARFGMEEDQHIPGEAATESWAGMEQAEEAPFVEVKDVQPEPTDLVDNDLERTETLAPTAEPHDVEIVGEDTDIIDEEIVQAMVARLVREELQGEVGEKITQTIRRFVRREIERALTLKGLE